MHEYDIALKSILMRPEGGFLTLLTGLRVTRWHNSELPEVQNRRADLLGETLDGRFVHVELQSTNDVRMSRRMLEYSVAIHRAFGHFPEQVVLYVGEAPVRMSRTLAGPGISYQCSIIDIRELDGEPLIESSFLGDNVIAVLAKLRDERTAVGRILERIAAADPAARARALAELAILGGLRKLGSTIEEETDRMPILNDIMDHEIIGRERKRGMAIGREEGRQEGERRVIMSLIAERFGSVPVWAQLRIESLGAPELERIASHLLRAGSLEELLGPSA